MTIMNMNPDRLFLLKVVLKFNLTLYGIGVFQNMSIVEINIVLFSF